MRNFKTVAIPTLLLSGVALVGACKNGGDAKLRVGVGYDADASQILVLLNVDLGEGQQLRARVRQGEAGELDCATMAGSIDAVSDGPVPSDYEGQIAYGGPVVESSVFEVPIDESWLLGPTPEQVAALEASKHTIDVCVMEEGKVVRQHEFDIREALDRAGKNGKFDGEDEELIRSGVAYAEACVAQLGDIPFFEPLGASDYGTYNCLDSTPIPTVITEDGFERLPGQGDPGCGVDPSSGHLQTTSCTPCNDPQFIYSSCEANAIDGQSNGPRVTSAQNEQGTHWVLLCRKAGQSEGQYNDVAMIGHNPLNGKTCFFQNELQDQYDGTQVPHPADREASEASPKTHSGFWLTQPQGGMGNGGIECAKCHDTDPFIHTPWIDGARNEDGTTVVPKMDEAAGLYTGFNDSPYTIINMTGQGWSIPPHLVSEEAAACTKCHRIGQGVWASPGLWNGAPWVNRILREDGAWTALLTAHGQLFENAVWMPPEQTDETSFPHSEFAQAMAFIRSCGQNQNACQWDSVPSDPILGEDGPLPVVEYEGRELALEALKILGADFQDPSCPDGNCANERCARAGCHNVTHTELTIWASDHSNASYDCGLRDLENGVESMSQEQARAAVDCMLRDRNHPDIGYHPAKMGLFAAGVQFSGMRQLFQKAYGDEWIGPYTRLRATAQMPRGGSAKLSLQEYAVVRKWFDEYIPNLDDFLEQPVGPQCQPSLDAATLAAHFEDMKFEGWGAVNQQAGIRMFGCEGDDSRQCLAQLEDKSSEWGAGVGKTRLLKALDYGTSYWMRSSADGRFIANGGSTITDLLRNVDMPVDASYDPGFFPDNSGFMFHGGDAWVCPQSILEDDDRIDFDEPGCSGTNGIQTYQHMARGLGGDYLVITGSHDADDPGDPQYWGEHGAVDPPAGWGATAYIRIDPMIFNGTTYEQLPHTTGHLPFEGDGALSPSGRLLVSRLRGPDRGVGYVIRKVETERVGDVYDVDVSQKLGEVCMGGAKLNISFSERFFVTYVRENGTSNIYLVDMKDGQSHRISNMPQGYAALFPHFISNDWIYYLVYGPDGTRFAVASDAALAIAEANP